MTDPATCSARLVEAYNRRDLDAIEAMVAAEVDYRRPGAPTLRTPAEVRGVYAEDFRAMPDVQARITEVIAQSGTDVAVELLIVTSGLELPGAAHHRWVDDKLTRYRAWVEPPT